MAKIIKIEVNSSKYGITELNVERVIAVIPDKCRVLFENVYWDLDEKNFNILYKAWKGDNPSTELEPREDKGVLVNDLRDLSFFSVKTLNVLLAADIRTVEDLIKLRKEDILRMRSAGKTTINDIESFFNKYGLKWNNYG